jgi:hypothetical protein
VAHLWHEIRRATSGTTDKLSLEVLIDLSPVRAQGVSHYVFGYDVNATATYCTHDLEKLLIKRFKEAAKLYIDHRIKQCWLLET